ncbi:hypothetical protein A5893_00175 [Pedobacter psychrophilus]|uniref:Uncharacterized protein n=1 Tax=Pedobacter psychrophilus TaxID=1826909 RepID=A0A179DM17_9SPHI|nr:hypothetical protein [Pedobacter psychrophilus]OAQ41569.1 hypothetical protein A5893_00175 [Pedobacter psychrophilus]
MQENQFITYQKFTVKDEVEEFSKFLEENNIEFEFEDNSISFDPTFANNDFGKIYFIKLKKADFEKVDKIQNEISINLSENIDKDHYLNDFTDDELIEVIVKSEEWSKLNFSLAQKILKQRGKEITSDQLKELKRQRIEELAKPEQSQKAWIIAGYIFSVLGGFIGIFIGKHLFSHKKTLPNGETVFAHTKSERNHGNRIFILGIICFISWTLVRIISIE